MKRMFTVRILAAVAVAAFALAVMCTAGCRKDQKVQDTKVIQVATADIPVGVEPVPAAEVTPTASVDGADCTDAEGTKFADGYKYAVGAGTGIAVFECRDGQFVQVSCVEGDKYAIGTGASVVIFTCRDGAYVAD